MIFFIYLMTVVFLAGCAPKYACKETVDGISCNSITAVYQKEIEGKPLGKKGKKKKISPSKSLKISTRDDLEKLEKTEIVTNLELHQDKPLRVPPKIIRVWIAPWEGADGDLHQPEYIYSEITDKRGRWIIGEKEQSTEQLVTAPDKIPAVNNDVKKEPKQKSGVPRNPFKKVAPAPRTEPANADTVVE